MRRVLLALAAVTLVAVAGAAVAAADDGVIQHEGENATLAAGPGQVITGHTDLPADTRVTVRLEARPDSVGALDTAIGGATVDGNGTFTKYYDLSRMVPGDVMTVTVRHEDEVIAEETVEVVACEGECTQRTPVSEEWPPDEPALHPGGVAVYDDSPATLDVWTGGADTMTLEIGGEHEGYRQVATVTDGDGDDRVRLRVDVSREGARLATVDEADEVVVRDVSGDVSVREYGLTLYPGDTPRGGLADHSLLAVRESAFATETEVPTTSEAESVTASAVDSSTGGPPTAEGRTDWTLPVLGTLLAVGALATRFSAFRG